MENLQTESLSGNKGVVFLPKLNMLNTFQPHLRLNKISSSYYGNYEGDSTMFPGSPSRTYSKPPQYDLNDIDDYDHESEKGDGSFNREDNISRSYNLNDELEVKEKVDNYNGGLPPAVQTRKQLFVQRIMNLKIVQQVLPFIEILSNQKICKYFIESAQLVYFAIVWATTYIYHNVLKKSKLSDASYVMGCLRNFNRQILWWMTLSKSGDVLHFGRMVLASPLVFLIAAAGLLIALGKCIKYNMKSMGICLNAAWLWVQELNNQQK